MNHDHNAHEMGVGALGCNGRRTRLESQPAISRARDCFYQSLPISIECAERDTPHNDDLEIGLELDAVRVTRRNGGGLGGTVGASGTGSDTDGRPASVFLLVFRRCHPFHRATPRAENGDAGSIVQGAGSNFATGATARREEVNDGDECRETVL